MKSTKWPFYLGVSSSLLIGFVMGSFIFGMLVHESSHAIACLIFGLRIESYSLTHVTCYGSSDSFVSTSVKLAGGVGQALSSLLFFWYATTFEKRALTRVVFRKAIDSRNSPILGIVLGFEAALLIVAFHGVVNGIWEGFFFDNYSRFYSNVLLSAIIILFGGIISFLVVRRRYRRLHHVQ